MEASSDTLTVNHHYLKSCIYYEVLQKKPIFDSYRNFCDTVGKDAMDYPDFQFWYYRFYHGSRDFDYDRSVDPEPKTLVDIPVVIMKKISNYLDPVERTCLRIMNRAMKNVADSFPPVFENIQVMVSDWSITWTLNSKRFSCKNERRGCSLSKPNCSIEKSDEYYIKKGLEYLAPVLKMPNIQVKHFSLQLFDETLNPNDLLPVPFNPKSAFIHCRSTNKVVQFLSAMTPGHLESLGIDVSSAERRENYGIIYETDQFKQAKNVELKPVWGFNVEDLAIFSHLKKFKCHLRSNNAFEDVPRIRDTVLTFENFKSCVLSFSSGFNRFPMRGIADALGEEIPIGPIAEREHRTITHRYCIPDSNECLKFKITEEQWQCRVLIVKVS
ncbi:hypothetical protein B9Z55_026942 [Caenorhabditis nigoni]|uniref:F-box domain-containing protein n=1 Tax=Caenorhabditis nigoni TaxID=1611254 RepID=A0A2G5SI96_9PELO|nr:hypothetical protein B9Z55_026942 [Caenorhabditis nigoni]